MTVAESLSPALLMLLLLLVLRLLLKYGLSLTAIEAAATTALQQLEQEP